MIFVKEEPPLGVEWGGGGWRDCFVINLNLTFLMEPKISRYVNPCLIFSGLYVSFP